jgi:hypothetical protein
MDLVPRCFGQREIMAESCLVGPYPHETKNAQWKRTCPYKAVWASLSSLVACERSVFAKTHSLQAATAALLAPPIN